MRLSLFGLLAAAASATTTLASALTAADWATEAAKSKDGIITLDTTSYDELLAAERDYGVTILLTALPAQYKCTPCHEFQPVFESVAASWRRVPKDKRDQHFFAQLDFSDGQAIFQRLGLQSAPVVNYFPPTVGPRKQPADRVVQNYDLNRAGLSLGNLHMWVRQTTPAPFEIYKPMSPVPFIIAPIVLAGALYSAWQARRLLLPIITSRLVWGTGSIISLLIFTTGHMWVKIKNAPYVQAGRDGTVNWIAGGYSNQLGLEGQVMAGLYGLGALCIIVLSVFIPAQSSPIKQRIGTLLWVAMMVGTFSVIIRLFRIKNGGYPYHLL